MATSKLKDEGHEFGVADDDRTRPVDLEAAQWMRENGDGLDEAGVDIRMVTLEKPSQSHGATVDLSTDAWAASSINPNPKITQDARACSSRA